jgi:hypothetical protein
MQNYPRVLVVALGRINLKDTYNNGLFIRNLFGTDWPKDHLAQIYSSGDNNDSGFFGKYYCIGAKERFLGSIFYRLKSTSVSDVEENNTDVSDNFRHPRKIFMWLKSKVLDLLVNTGLYEIIFLPKLSSEIKEWVAEFKPDIIFAQGYNLTFTWLPMMLKKETNAKLAVLTTDDWPSYQYAGMHGESTLLKWLIRPVVKKSAELFFKKADFSFAFGWPMAEEFKKRYKKNFTVLNHSDDPKRFSIIQASRVYSSDIITIVAVGTFNKYRYPLLMDLDEACIKLNESGLNVRVAVFSSSIDFEGQKAIVSSRFIKLFPDPGNDELPARLKGADILILIEGFDEKFVSAIKLSVSSKAHLFMLSQRPIIVYSGPDAGIARYAKSLGWARTVCERSSFALKSEIENILKNPEESIKLIKTAYQVADSNHTHFSNRYIFISTLSF